MTDTNNTDDLDIDPEDTRYGYSWVTDTWYKVYDWEDREGDMILAENKEEVPREEVPQRYLDATDERPDDHDTPEGET